MNTPKNDRRSQRTQQLLHYAFFTLMQEKRYDDITVQDIIDRANIGRSTFYAHYQDKEDLATGQIANMLDQLGEALAIGTPGNQRLLPTRELFQHVQEQYNLFKAMMRGRGMDMFFEKGQAYWSQKLESYLNFLLPEGGQSTIPIPLLANYLSGTLVMMLKWWLDNKMPYSPEQMDEFIHQLVMPGVEAAIGAQT